jgi:hypothetical protein
MYADIRSLICRDNDLLLIFHKFELLAVELVFFLSTTETSVNFYKTTPPSITEDHLFTRRRENLKSFDCPFVRLLSDIDFSISLFDLYNSRLLKEEFTT